MEPRKGRQRAMQADELEADQLLRHSGMRERRRLAGLDPAVPAHGDIGGDLHHAALVVEETDRVAAPGCVQRLRFVDQPHALRDQLCGQGVDIAGAGMATSVCRRWVIRLLLLLMVNSLELRWSAQSFGRAGRRNSRVSLATSRRMVARARP